MTSISTVLFFVFHLTVGTSSFDAKEFARLQGEWQVQSVTEDGVSLPAEEWQTKTIVFAEAKTPVKPSAVVYGGRLRTKGKMSWLETKTVAAMLPQAKALTTPKEEEYSASYEIKGDTMKLLLLRVLKPNDRGPAGLLEHPDGKRGRLFFLKRKPSK